MTKIVYIAHIIPVTVKEYPQSRRMIVSLDRINRRIGDIECLYQSLQADLCDRTVGLTADVDAAREKRLDLTAVEREVGG